MHNVLLYPGHLQRLCMLLKRKSNKTFFPTTLNLHYSDIQDFLVLPLSCILSPFLEAPYFPLCVFNLFPFLPILLSQFFTPFPATILPSAHLYISLLLYQTSISHGSLIPFPSVYYFPFCLISTFFFFKLSYSGANIKINIRSLR